MAWNLLIVAGLLEIVWAYTMKLSQGFTRVGMTVVTLLTLAASFALLSVAMRTLPLGTAYTVRTGILSGQRCSVSRLVGAFGSWHIHERHPHDGFRQAGYASDGQRANATG